MARKLRIEYPGALYHVINRGNYRTDVFASDGAKDAFLSCLGEACEKSGWKVQAYVVMRNHYHLALETPRGNLVDGMQWLQSTYASRFNRMRGEHGHVFQGRYQAILVEDGGHFGPVAHYIHLNPVRARIVKARGAGTYRWSSLHLLAKAKERPAWLSLEDALHSAGELVDTPAGHAAYAEYLVWLSEDWAAQRAFAFENMCSGWAIGTQGFKRDLIETHTGVLAAQGLESAATEIKHEAWSKAVEACMEALGKTRADIEADIKAAPWKVAIAAHLRRVSTVKNPWLAENLRMGDPDGVSRYVSEARRGLRIDASKLEREIVHVRV